MPGETTCPLVYICKKNGKFSVPYILTLQRIFLKLPSFTKFLVVNWTVLLLAWMWKLEKCDVSKQAIKLATMRIRIHNKDVYI